MTETKMDLPKILTDHALWQQGKGGCRANLTGASLTGANLTRASLDGANLTGASLTGASLTGASLTRASLTGASLGYIKNDFLSAVLWMPNELDALRAALIAGKINGSVYAGECSCLAGTLAKARGIADYAGENIGDFTASASSPRERWFMGIKPGDTPETNQVARIALDWTDEAIRMRDAIRGKS